MRINDAYGTFLLIKVFCNFYVLVASSIMFVQFYSLQQKTKVSVSLVNVFKRFFLVVLPVFVLETTAVPVRNTEERLLTLVVPVHCNNRISSTGLAHQHTTLTGGEKEHTFKHQKPTYTFTHTHTHTRIYSHTHSRSQLLSYFDWEQPHQHHKPTDAKGTLLTVQKSKNISKYTIIIYSSSILPVTLTIDTQCEFIRMYINMYRLNTSS